jgi:TPR repeat protein
MKTIRLIALTLLTSNAHAGVKCILESGRVAFQQGTVCRKGTKEFTFSLEKSRSYKGYGDIKFDNLNKLIQEEKNKTDAANRTKALEAQKFRELLKAADQGNAEAQNELGLIYYYGRGVDRDYSQAEDWFRKSADRGNESAKNALVELDFRPRVVGSQLK